MLSRLFTNPGSIESSKKMSRLDDEVTRQYLYSISSYSYLRHLFTNNKVSLSGVLLPP
jgi:hypothetical protein